jgi:hypothetical protein
MSHTGTTTVKATATRTTSRRAGGPPPPAPGSKKYTLLGVSRAFPPWAPSFHRHHW